MAPGKYRNTQFATLSELMEEKGVVIAQKVISQINESGKDVVLLINDEGKLDIDLSRYTFCFCFNDFEMDEAAQQYLLKQFWDGIRCRGLGRVNKTVDDIVDLVHKQDDGVMVVDSNPPKSRGRYDFVGDNRSH